MKLEIISREEAPTSIDQPIKQSSVSSFLLCFFKNRLFNSDPELLGKNCFPTDALSRWRDVFYCHGDEEEKKLTNSLFANVSTDAKDELKKNNGLAVRVAGKFIDLKTTSLVDAICEQLTVIFCKS